MILNLKYKFYENKIYSKWINEYNFAIYLHPWNLIYKTIFTFTQLLGANYYFSGLEKNHDLKKIKNRIL